MTTEKEKNNTNKTHKTITANILNNRYRISVSIDKVHALEKAIEYLNKKIHSMQKSKNILANERTIVMAALTISDELLSIEKEYKLLIENVDRKTLLLQKSINQVLINNEQLELPKINS